MCKEFYFGVLGIDSSRVRRFHEKTEQGAGELHDMRGKKTQRRTPQEEMEFIKQHISSFPRVPLHYCRSGSKKEDLEPGLSLSKMYELYCFECEQCGKSPLKVSMYRKIFQTEYNISFHMPNKDRCDVCELQKNSPAEDGKFQAHILDKGYTKQEGDHDRNDTTSATLCFDLQNVITLPKAEIKNFFYK